MSNIRPKKHPSILQRYAIDDVVVTIRSRGPKAKTESRRRLNGSFSRYLEHRFVNSGESPIDPSLHLVHLLLDSSGVADHAFYLLLLFVDARDDLEDALRVRLSRDVTLHRVQLARLRGERKLAKVLLA